MVPENVIWAFYSVYDYQRKYDSALNTGSPVPKDIYYKNIKGEWLKVTAVFSCIDHARRDYRLGDAKYLGPVLENTKAEVERGSKWPLPSKEQIEADRKSEILNRRKSVESNIKGKMIVKNKLIFPNNDIFNGYSTVALNDCYTTGWDWSK
jgi:hypothetical protein